MAEILIIFKICNFSTYLPNSFDLLTIEFIISLNSLIFNSMFTCRIANRFFCNYWTPKFQLVSKFYITLYMSTCLSKIFTFSKEKNCSYKLQQYLKLKSSHLLLNYDNIT